MSIEFSIEENELILEYYPSYKYRFIIEELNLGKVVVVHRCFSVKKERVLDCSQYDESVDSGYIKIKLAVLENDYYKIEKEILGSKHDFYFYQTIEFNEKMFVAYQGISILPKISNLVKRDMYIGGEEDSKDMLPIKVFEALIKSFPNTSEIKNYRNLRISSILHDYFEGLGNVEVDYEKYLNKRSLNIESKLGRELQPLKLKTLEASLGEIKKMLDDFNPKCEKYWQEVVCDIIQIIYPKYILALREVDIGTDGDHNKKPDFLLVDSNGLIDVLEIKRPDNYDLMSNSLERNNYIPTKKFTGALFQTEKYIYTLTHKNTKQKSIFKKVREKLVVDVTPQIINPRGMLLIGRSNNLNESQKRDFEIIKRQYKNIVEVMTYDDLVCRLENMVKQLKIKENNESLNN